MADCPLCRRVVTTRFYYEDEITWIVDCDTCDVPMAVLKRHDRTPTSDEKEHMWRTLEQFGKGSFDDVMRRIPDHYHVHLREGWF